MASLGISWLRADHVLGEFQRMDLMEAKLRQAVALKNDVIDELKDVPNKIWKDMERYS